MYAARTKRAYKLRQQPVEGPGTVDCPGFIFAAVKAFLSLGRFLPAMCVSQATLPVYSRGCGGGMEQAALPSPKVI